MKPHQPWHSTPLGVAVRWLGSIQLAVPVLTLVAAALIWGTFLESAVDAKAAKAQVYGSWWFMALMALVCISLVFATVTRFPWRRKHVGFLVVHASLVALIVGGFWSLFGRIEGRMWLEEGNASAMIEMTEEQLEIVEHDSGNFRVVDSVPAPRKAGRVKVGGLDLEIVELWDNVTEQVDVVDEGQEPYRAVQIAFGPDPASAAWIGDEAKGAAPTIAGLHIRVLGEGVEFQPPTDDKAQDAQRGYAFVVGDRKTALGEVGQEVMSGWTVTSIKRFSHASVSAGGITDQKDKDENPAVDVEISDGKGTTERHTAFELFPDMVMSKTLQGSARSGARLVPLGPPRARRGEETLVVHGDPASTKLTYISAAGRVVTLDLPSKYPFLADFGERKVSVVNQFTHATEKSRFTKGPPAKDRRPALVVRLGESMSPLAWKAMLPVDLGGRPGLLRFGPRNVRLPFTVTLEQFRKTDYPGTEMAMAYESDVKVNSPDMADQKTTISMNNPLVRSGWKVYQSGFEGDTISVFSIMRDPGLPLTYLSCFTLCVGILIVFYGRGLSWGHPGIPVPFSGKEQSHAPVAVQSDPSVVVADTDVPVGRGADAPVGA